VKNQSHVMFMSTTLKTDDNSKMITLMTPLMIFILLLSILRLLYPFRVYCSYKCYFLDVCFANITYSTNQILNFLRTI